MAQFTPAWQGGDPSNGQGFDQFAAPVGPIGGYNYGPAQGPWANPNDSANGFNKMPSNEQSQMDRINGGGGQSGGGKEWFNGQNWNPTFHQYGGYNPLQYATTDTANTLAGQVGSGLGLGGNVIQTRNAPGFGGAPPQASIDFGGDSPLNAGLLADRYKKYDHATADQMTRDELAMQGPRRDPNADSQGGAMGSWSMFEGLPGGAPNLGGGQNIGQFVGENAGWRGPGNSPGVTPGAQPANPLMTPPGQAPTVPAAATPAAATPAAPDPFAAIRDYLANLEKNRQSSFRNPFANSRYYPNLPRFGNATPVNSGSSAQTQPDLGQLLSLLLGF